MNYIQRQIHIKKNEKTGGRNKKNFRRKRKNKKRKRRPKSAVEYLERK